MVAICVLDGPAFLRSAELPSGVGAIVLGAGLGLLAPLLLQRYALLLLGAGLLLHGAGMTLKYRLEAGSREPQWWDRTLFWACWVILLATLGWVAIALLTQLPV